MGIPVVLSSPLPDWTPHSGYHWSGGGGRFFEGWYCRLTLPGAGDSVAFMYAINDPAGDSVRSGGSAQILGPGATYLNCPFPAVAGFWAWRHQWGLGHWGEGDHRGQSPRPLETETFWQTISQGYQLTPRHHQGVLRDPVTGCTARWDYTVEPVATWGPAGHPPRPTAGWLSYLPIFDPGWQVTLAHGWGQGWLEWQGRRYDFQRAPVYHEKNWGRAFPRRWFWIQGNAFPAFPGLSVTVAGAERQVFNRWETVGMVGIHYQGEYFDLNSLKGQVTWQVTPWGQWQVQATTHQYGVTVVGTCTHPPTQVQVPTHDGMVFRCWDTTHGHLAVTLWHRRSGQVLLSAVTDLGGLEVGGAPWVDRWVWE